MGFWAGVVGEMNRIEDRNERRDEFNRKIREDRINTMATAAMRYGASTTSSTGGVESSTGSTVAASALQNDNLTYLKSVGISDETLSSFIAAGPTAVNDAASLIRTTRVEFSETPNLVTPDLLNERLRAATPIVIRGDTLDWDEWKSAFNLDLTEEDRAYLEAITPPARDRVVMVDNWVPPVTMPKQDDIDKFNQSASGDITFILENRKAQLSDQIGAYIGLPSDQVPENLQSSVREYKQIESDLERINNSDGSFVPQSAVENYGIEAVLPRLAANPAIIRASDQNALSGVWGRVVNGITRVSTREELEALEPGTPFISMIPGYRYQVGVVPAAQATQ